MQLNSAPFQVKDGFLNSRPGQLDADRATPQGLAGDFLDLGPVAPVIDGNALAALFSTGAEFGAAYTSFAGIFDTALGSVPAANIVCGLQMGPASVQGSAMTAEEAKQAKWAMM